MQGFYYKISNVMEDLIIGIVALGILVVSFEYIQFYIDFKDQIIMFDFLERIFLFIAVIMFTAYYFVSYSAYFSNKDFDNKCDIYSARRMVVMYLLDLMSITVASWLYAVLLIGVLTSTPNNIPDVASQLNLKITINDMNAIFTIMLIWHSIITIWYFIALGSRSDKVLHIIYSLIYLGLYVLTDYVSTHIFVWFFIAIYIILVLSLYYFKGIPDIQKAIDSHKEDCC